MRFVSGWRLALRMAWREAWRAKGRTLLVLVMVTFPVVAVVAADVAQATASVSSVEGLDRRIGSAEALVTLLPGSPQVAQAADPDQASSALGGHGNPTSLARVVAALGGGDRPKTELRSRGVSVRTRLGGLAVLETGVDLTDPLTHGLFRITDGHLPTSDGQVLINRALADQGFHLGSHIQVRHGSTTTVVGYAESAANRTQPIMVAPLDSLPAPRAHEPATWLVGGPPVTWDDVRAANLVGATVLSRDVIEHPPSKAQLSPRVRSFSSTDRSQLYAVLALVAAMALIEVVLLAGPAFAVGARRQSRSLALIAANGGTPVQSRRVVLGSAVVIGAVAAVVGVVLGIGLGRVVLPSLQSMSQTYFGPFQIRWVHLLGIAAFGLLSAFLAAVVPAWIASRQDVVAVLAGRRGDRAADKRSPFIGVALVAAGIVVAALGAKQGSGEGLIAVAAILTVFGMIFLVPVVVLGVARLGRRFALPLRYAVRDAARHRTRTVPAVAAVAATVAGVVALSIGNTSDQAQARADYVPQLSAGDSSVAMNSGHTDWAQVDAAVTRVAPGAAPSPVIGVRGSRALEVQLGQGQQVSENWMSPLPVQALVSDGGAVPAFVRGQVSDQEWQQASAVLRAGGAVVFGHTTASVPSARLHLSGRHGPSVRVPAFVVGVGDAQPPVLGVLSPRVAHALSLRVQTVGLLLTGDTLSASQNGDLQQVLSGIDQGAYLYTERGYQVSGAQKVVLWILFGLAGVLMLGGTLTATFLALSDARPDLATLSAVGASPRMRRAVAGVVGAVLGAAVGFVPGIAVSYPLTRSYGGPGPSHYLSIPWLEIVAVVIALPLLTAVVVGLVARSRLPLVARLD